MLRFDVPPSPRASSFFLAVFLGLSACLCAPLASAKSAYVRVNQIGYEAGDKPLALT